MRRALLWRYYAGDHAAGALVMAGCVPIYMKVLYMKCSVMRKNPGLNLVFNSSDPDEEGVPLGDVAVQESRPELAAPPMYKVVILNDDYTPMDFVVEILESFFSMDREKATRIMLTIHTQGQATCGIYTRDVAETKAAQVVDYAQQNQHPLLCQVQQA